MYFWLKFFHIAAMAIWFTGLFFLPRLLVARHTDETDGDRDVFVPTAGMLYFRIMSPAALITITLGMVLIAYGPTGAWLVMKLVVVALAVSVHLYFGVMLYEIEQGRDRHNAWFYRITGWVPLLLLLTVAALTGAKPMTAPPLPPPPLEDAARRG